MSITTYPSCRGQTAIVTGATGGLGLATATGLARCGAEVIVTGRNAEKGREALMAIEEAVPGAKLRFEGSISPLLPLSYALLSV